MQPRHPEITVKLVGEDGNAFNPRPLPGGGADGARGHLLLGGVRHSVGRGALVPSKRSATLTLMQIG
jgi:hypothetical protein